MSFYGVEILKRINQKSELANPNNPAYKIIDNGLGEWLDNLDVKGLFDGLFLQDAENEYLALQGNQYNVLRKPDESDEDYRKRIIYETLGRLTVDYLLDVYDFEVYVYIEDYNPTSNQLTSDNPYLSKFGFMVVADEETRKILEKKFVIGRELHWLIL